MRRSWRTVCWLTLTVLVSAALLLAAAASGAPRGKVQSIELSGTIDPASQRWLHTALQDARDRHAPLVIIRIDTPGGLDTSMRAMVKDIIGAPMPVVVYVSPNGARAASAGLFVTQAADVAAMATQTNIGSATPISLGGGGDNTVLGRKIRNDAAAYVRALAEGHGRNGDLSEQMVRKAVNVTASHAHRVHLIDLVAPSQAALLHQLDGFRVKGPKARVLHTAGLQVENRDTPLQYKILQVLVDPTVAYLLLVGGLVGLVIELFSPGVYAPGVLGGIAFVLGLIGTSYLPVTAAGIILILLAVAFFAVELKLGGHGILGVAGVIALIVGGLILFDTGSSAFRVSVPIALGAGAVLGSLVLFAVSKAVAARRGPVRTGSDELLGDVGTVRAPVDPVGQVFVDGALWRARAANGERLERGDRVRVEAVQGLTLTVRPENGKSSEGE
ncbi:MAG TPA: nodulation protein NfeD [Thermoleophilaceae bacterium]|jgi:membrane-bound serine protease (ClpP class)|nr:nodulation protein NfeD [Thermoleophilaceae bacterium]